MNLFEKEYYESHTFWDGEMLQDPYNKDRIINTAALIPTDTKTLADIGCGNGIFVNYLLDNYKNIQVTGVDRSRTALKYVRSNKIEADIESLPFENNNFDCVTCLEVIEHLPIPVYKSSLKELARIAKKHIIISVPYDEKLEDSYTRCPSCRTIFNKEIHLRSFKEEDVINLFNEFGFECTLTKKLNPTEIYKGHSFYRKLFYPEQLTAWASPICPLCGYVETSYLPLKKEFADKDMIPPKRKWISYLAALPKLFWPKKTHFYWILARYDRVNSDEPRT
jgi:SAM-dependent methyltransferase